MALVSSASGESVLVLSAEKHRPTNRQPSTDCTGVISKTHHIVNIKLHPSGEVTTLQRRWTTNNLFLQQVAASALVVW